MPILVAMLVRQRIEATVYDPDPPACSLLQRYVTMLDRKGK